MAKRIDPVQAALTRRQFLGTLAVTAAGVKALTSSVLAQGSTGVLRVRTINHVGIAVSDVQRSAEFYQRVFGLSALRTVDGGHALDFNGHFVQLIPQSKGGLITHFCMGVDGFQTSRDAAAIRAAGFEVARVSDTFIDVRDPDGTNVRIADPRYTAACANCGSSPNPAGSSASGAPILRARTLNHVNFGVSNLQRSAVFYQKLFGLPRTLRPLHPPAAGGYGLDFNECYLSIGLGSKQPGTVTHFCFGVENIDLKRDAEKLRNAGFTVRELGTPPAVYVNDPDGLGVQISDPAWKSACPTCDPAPVL